MQKIGLELHRPKRVVSRGREPRERSLHPPEVRFTDASCAQAESAEDDASAASKEIGYEQAVCQTSAGPCSGQLAEVNSPLYRSPSEVLFKT